MLDDFTRQGKSAATQWFNRAKLEALFSRHGFSGGGVRTPLGLSGRCHQAPAKASSRTPPPNIFIHPPERKYENPSLVSLKYVLLDVTSCESLYFTCAQWQSSLSDISLNEK
jgi:hypothetical protein